MTLTSAPGTGCERPLIIRGRRGRRETRKILDNDPAGCYIQGRKRGKSCVRRAPPPQQCVADGETVQRWGALPVRPLPETSPRHAPCPLPPRSGGPLGSPAPPVSPRPAALGHRPRRARGWPPAPRWLGDPPRGPAGLGPAGCARQSWRLPCPPRALENPGSPAGHERGLRSSWRPASRCPTPATRDRPGRRRARPGRTSRRRPPPCAGPRQRRPTCRGRWPWPGRSPARWRGRGRSLTPRPPCGPCGRPLLPRPWPWRPAGPRPVPRPLPAAARHRFRPA